MVCFRGQVKKSGICALILIVEKGHSFPWKDMAVFAIGFFQNKNFCFESA
jgi:hypothetical protein